MFFTNFYGNDDGQPEVDAASEEVERGGRRVEEIVRDGIKDGRRISVAALQGTFIRHDAKDALTSTRELLAVRL